MKYAIWGIVLLLFTITVSADLSDDLYSYFPMDDKNDVLGYAKTGEWGSVEYTPGLIGNALNITTDSADDMIYFGDSVSHRDDTFRDVLYNSSTINVWVYVREWDSLTGGTFQIIGGNPHEKQDNGGCEGSIIHFQFSIRNVPFCKYGNCPQNNGDEVISFQAHSYDSSRNIDSENNINLKGQESIVQSKNWHMISVTHNAETHTWKLYVDGEVVSSEVKSSALGTGALEFSCPYAIGNRPIDNQYGFPFAGLIDELGVWDRALSEQEIAVLYNNGAGMTYPFGNVCGDGVLEHGEMCDDGNTADGDGCSSLCEQETDLLLQYAPAIIVHPNETYGLKNVNSVIYESMLVSTDMIEDSVSPLDLGVIPQSQKYSLDIHDSDWHAPPIASRFEEYEQAVYAREIVKDNYTHLQYYFFFPYQEWLPMNHEGDWEMFQVTLDEHDQFESAQYYFHHFVMSYYDKTWLDFVEGHPVVLIAKGNHNVFMDEGSTILDGLLLDEYFSFFEDLFARYIQMEDISDDGELFLPGNGTGMYELRPIIEEPWFTYEGRWGEEAPLLINRGPRAPKYDPRFVRRWKYPERYTVAPDFPFMSAFLFSPLDMVVYDADGKSLEENYILDSGSDAEPESITVIGETEYSIVFNATSTGNFTLEIYYYDNASGVKLTFKGQVVNESKGVLDIGPDSDYLLHMDTGGDGTYERTITPEIWSVHNDFAIPDTDEDGFNNFIDNCYLIPNDQSDFNSDGKGDACDNPRYYKELALELSKNPAHALIRNSLADKYWRDEFTITSNEVFILEHNAAKKAEAGVSYYLAKADKLIVEHLMVQANSNIRTSAYYEAANILFSHNLYVDAIQMYAQAWNAAPQD